jgi:hypothetical protein
VRLGRLGGSVSKNTPGIRIGRDHVYMNLRYVTLDFSESPFLRRWLYN